MHALLLVCFGLADPAMPPSAASCNLKYRSAPEWTGKECLLNATVWGESSQVTWGASNNLPKLHRAVSDVVSLLFQGSLLSVIVEAFVKAIKRSPAAPSPAIHHCVD